MQADKMIELADDARASQTAVRIRVNELGRWWQSLSGTHRAALKEGELYT